MFFEEEQVKSFFNQVSLWDSVAWVFVISFFYFSAALNGGERDLAFIGAAGIIVCMFIINVSIDTITGILENYRGLGTFLGFLNNGPELLCVTVGLLTNDLIFAASTPLGANIMNPIVLVMAALICGQLKTVFGAQKKFLAVTLAVTILLASTYYLVEPKILWIVTAVVATVVVFLKRPKVKGDDSLPQKSVQLGTLIVAIVLLVVAGYFLNFAVDYSAQMSKAPKGLIGFLVLAMLTSWPEFKSSQLLIKDGKYSDAVLNITVSNITNLWLVCTGSLLGNFLGKLN